MEKHRISCHGPQSRAGILAQALEQDSAQVGYEPVFEQRGILAQAINDAATVMSITASADYFTGGKLREAVRQAA